MARQTLNTGVTPNDGLGDTLRNGAQKINENFVEVYADVTNLRSDLTVAQVEIVDIANTITTLATTSYVDAEIAQVSNTISNLIDNDNQSLSFTNGQLSISGGNSVNLNSLTPDLTPYATLNDLNAGLAATSNSILNEVEPGLQPQSLAFDSNTSILTITGGNFVNLSSLAGGGGTTINALGDIGDVSNSAPTTGQVLKWNGSIWGPADDATGSGTVGIGNVSEDTTPQLGGDLDVSGYAIVSVSAGNIAITPDTTGSIVLDGLNWPQADGSANQVLKTDGAGNLDWVDQTSTPTPTLEEVVTTGAIVSATQVQFGGGILTDTIDPVNALGPITITGPVVFDNANTQIANGPLSVNGAMDIFGELSASRITSTGTGSPSLVSSTDLTLQANGVVEIIGAPLVLAGFTSTQRDALVVTGGEIIFNSTLNRAEFYDTAKWVGITATGNEAITTFSSSTTYNPGSPISPSNYFQDEAGNGDIEVSVTVSQGFTKAVIELNTAISNTSDPTSEVQVALVRLVNGLNPTVVKTCIFPVLYGGINARFLDTHGASTGDTITYKIRNEMGQNGYGSDNARLQYAISGDTISVREVL